MSTSLYRSQLEQKRKEHLKENNKLGSHRKAESTKRSDASKARIAASKTSSATRAKSKMAEAERKEKEASKASEDANRAQAKVDKLAGEILKLEDKLRKSTASDEQNESRRRARNAQRAEREQAREQDRLENRVAAIESEFLVLRAPKPEALRILLLASSSDSDDVLRVGREQTRIRRAVDAAKLRDRVKIDARPSATTQDLLDGLANFRPHVVHFSGHSDSNFLVFEEDVDEPHPGVPIPARAFARAVEAVDEPPLLVLFNSCDSLGQAGGLVERGAIPMAIGMNDAIEDGDAIAFAARFYASIASGQSVGAAVRLGQADLELSGLPGAESVSVVSTPGVDTDAVLLVSPPEDFGTDQT